MRIIASSIAVALLITLLSTPAFACKRTFSDWLIPPPDTVPSDVEFTFRNETGDPIQVTLLDSAGDPVPLDSPVQFDGDFSTIKPSQPLTDGDYTLYVGDPASSDEQQQPFTVRADATHAVVDGTLSLEAGQNTETTSCGESPWFALVTLRNPDGLPPIAFFLNEIEYADGSTRTISAGQYLFPNEQWDPNTSEVVYSTGTSKRPECVDITAVLTTGKQVPLGSACDPAPGGGCSSTGSDVPNPLPLSVLVAFVGIGLIRREGARESS